MGNMVENLINKDSNNRFNLGQFFKNNILAPNLLKNSKNLSSFIAPLIQKYKQERVDIQFKAGESYNNIEEYNLILQRSLKYFESLNKVKQSLNTKINQNSNFNVKEFTKMLENLNNETQKTMFTEHRNINQANRLIELNSQEPDAVIIDLFGYAHSNQIPLITEIEPNSITVPVGYPDSENKDFSPNPNKNISMMKSTSPIQNLLIDYAKNDNDINFVQNLAPEQEQQFITILEQNINSSNSKSKLSEFIETSFQELVNY